MVVGSGVAAGVDRVVLLVVVDGVVVDDVVVDCVVVVDRPVVDGTLVGAAVGETVVVTSKTWQTS